jgi:hypothetical protein
LDQTGAVERMHRMPDEHHVPEQTPAPPPMPPGMKPCEYCAEPIREAARKCTHCGSWQSWLGLFGASSTVVSLFVALIAVAGATFPALVDLFTPENSDLTFTFQSASPKMIAVFVTNRGKRPGSIGIVELEERHSDTILYYPLQIQGVGEFTPMLVPARDSKLLQLPLIQTVLVVENKKQKPTGCTLYISHTDFAGKKHESAQDVDCAHDVGTFIKANEGNHTLLYAPLKRAAPPGPTQQPVVPKHRRHQ